MHIIAYILFILQALSIFGNISQGGIFYYLDPLFFGGVSGVAFVLGSFLPLILGLILLRVHKKRKIKKQLVMFYCPICKGVNPGMPGMAQGCPECHKPTAEKPVLNSAWIKMTAAEQAELKQSWEA